jgi:DNA-binding NarL/FixJ family response regulator
MIHTNSSIELREDEQRSLRRQIVIAHTFPLLADGLEVMLRREGYVVSMLNPRRLNDVSVLSELDSKILITDCVGIQMLQCNEEMLAQPELKHVLSRAILVVDNAALSAMRDVMPCQVTRMVAPTSDFSCFLESIEAVVNGQSMIVPELKEFIDETDSADGPLLTERQIEVLRLISDGLTSKEIGQRLGISRRTAEKHRANMKSILKMNSTVELVLHGKRMNWVS